MYPTHYGGATPPAFAWLGSVIVAPLRVEGRLVGAIMVGGTTRARYTPDDAAIVAELARHAAIALRNAQRHDAVARAAQTDALTGLFNRGALLERLERELERSRRYGRSLAVIFFDSTASKASTTPTATSSATACCAIWRASPQRRCAVLSLVGRYGGEEFVAVLPETDGAQALVVAERLRANVARHRLDLASGEEVRATISAGVAVFPADATTMDTLLRIADTALYAAKAGGRNQVRYEPVNEQHPA